MDARGEVGKTKIHLFVLQSVRTELSIAGEMSIHVYTRVELLELTSMPEGMLLYLKVLRRSLSRWGPCL